MLLNFRIWRAKQFLKQATGEVSKYWKWDTLRIKATKNSSGKMEITIHHYIPDCDRWIYNKYKLQSDDTLLRVSCNQYPGFFVRGY